MAKDTRKKLDAAALELFSKNYYDVVSVAQICRSAGVSNGVFYRYYLSKEEIFHELLEDFLRTFGEELLAVRGNSVSERLLHFVEIVAGAAHRYAGQVTMFREGQYRHPMYERQLRDLYMQSVERVLERPVNEAEYLFLLSGLRFLSTRSRYDHLPMKHEVLLTILSTGVLNEPQTVQLEREPRAGDIVDPVPQDSGEALVDAGINLFGRHGYFAVQVADVVREAGLSVGTFYKWFDSKEEFLSEVVHQIGRRARHYLSTHAPYQGSRLDREVMGMWNFLGYFGHHREYYSIVREAEFVVPMAVKEYYDAFQRGYQHSLNTYPEEHRPVVANFLMGLSHYLGIEVLFSSRVNDVRGLVTHLGTLLQHGIAFDQGGTS